MSDFMPVELITGILKRLPVKSLLKFRKHERNNGGHSHVIRGFKFSSEEFFEMNFPESLIGLWCLDLSIMKYGESSIAVSTHQPSAEFHELWVMKEYGVVESWTKVLKIPRAEQYQSFPRVLGFRKNGEVLFQAGPEEMASLDLNSQQMETSFNLMNWQLIELHGVDPRTSFIYVGSYVESLVLLDKEVDVYSEDSVQSSGGENVIWHTTVCKPTTST